MKKLLFACFSLLFMTTSQAQVNAPRITIGQQTWMTRNLNTTTYRNGDTIPEVRDSVAWDTLTTGAWCNYQNNPANDRYYGKLYNWYAINDPRGLAPEGWHLPSDAEWEILTATLGGAGKAGGKMKEFGYSRDPKTGKTYSSGFNGLAAGNRFKNGEFLNINNYGYWWSTTEIFYDYAWYRVLYFDEGSTISRLYDFKRYGFSVRCIKD